jgi:acyl carrier protein
MTDKNENTGKIRAFIFDNFLFDAQEDALQNDTSFLEEGIIDSTGVLELVDWLEEEFEIAVDDEELIPENLDSVNLLAAYISRKTS